MSEIIIYKTSNNSIQVNVQFENETVWLTQTQLVELYQSSKANVSEHIKRIFEEGELDKSSTVRKEGNRDVEREIEYYNLDMIISLGYCMKSGIATQFRIWATQRLKEYLIKGFSIDSDRMKNMDGGNYWKELLTTT